MSHIDLASRYPGIFSNWRRLQQRTRRLQPHIPITTTGVLILIASLAALRGFGYQRMDLVVFALTVCALSIVLVSAVMVTVTGLLLRRRLAATMNTPLPALQAEAGYANETALQLSGHSWLPMMSLEWQVVAPSRMTTRVELDPDSGQLEEIIVPGHRCLGTQVTRLFTIRDVLGLCRFSWRMTQPMSLMVLPRTGNLRHLPLLRSMDSEDGIPDMRGKPEGDRMDIRRYAPGDSVRDIMWRVYARNRHLNVRLPEKSMFQADRTLAYLLSGESDEAAAGVARFAVTNGALGDTWIFGADGSPEVSRTANAALPLICGSWQAAGRSDKPGNNGSLDHFLHSQAGNQAACIVFAPALTGAWVQALSTTMRKFTGPFTVVLATDDLSQQTSAPWWQRLLFEPDYQQYGSGLTELQSLAAKLTGAGARVLIVDRQSGQTFDQGLKRV